MDDDASGDVAEEGGGEVQADRPIQHIIGQYTGQDGKAHLIAIFKGPFDPSPELTFTANSITLTAPDVDLTLSNMIYVADWCNRHLGLNEERTAFFTTVAHTRAPFATWSYTITLPFDIEFDRAQRMITQIPLSQQSVPHAQPTTRPVLIIDVPIYNKEGMHATHTVTSIPLLQ